jgi:hypothetical protein
VTADDRSRRRGPSRPGGSGRGGPPLPAEADRLQTFVLEVGRELGFAGTPVSETQDRLTRIAAAGGAPEARIVVLPTALVIALGRGGRTMVESVPQRTGCGWTRSPCSTPSSRRPNGAASARRTGWTGSG